MVWLGIETTYLGGPSCTQLFKRSLAKQFGADEVIDYTASKSLIKYVTTGKGIGGPTGGIKANVTRWIGQFQENGRDVTLRQGTSDQGAYILADVSGTWNKPDGPPFARKTIEKPNSRVIGVILITEAEGMKDYYFFKLSNPNQLVRSQAKQLRTSFGGKLESEKPFTLEDAKS